MNIGDKTIRQHDALDYTRHLYRHVEDWYTSADNKAQILLTLNGLFLGALGSATIFGGDSIESAVTNFGFESFLFFLIFLVSLGASITCSLFCLRSRLHPNHGQPDEPADMKNLWFFQMICTVRPTEFVRSLHEVYAEREVDILARNIQIFARNVVSKHRWFNNGYRFFVLGLICFIAFLSTFIARVYLSSLTGDDLEYMSMDYLEALRSFFSPQILMFGGSIVIVFEAIYWCLDYRERRNLEKFIDLVHQDLDLPFSSTSTKGPK